MTSVVVVRKGKSIAIAADALVTFGETRLPGSYEANEKIIKIGNSWIGMAGSTAHFEVMRRVLMRWTGPALESRHEVFDTFLQAHAILKEKFFLNPKEDEDDPYESSQITALIANPCGIFGIYSYREVFSFERFWAIGSGRSFALGAMFAAYGARRLPARLPRPVFVPASSSTRVPAGPIRVHTMTR